MSDVIILAGGPSVRRYNLHDLEQRGTLIAISGAALLTKPHIAFTMDRLVAEYCYPQWRVQGVPSVYIRECVVKNFKPGPEVKLFQHDGPATSMSLAEYKLNGSNSGSCALNLAFQRLPKQVFLLGYDMQRDRGGHPYWHPPYPWNTAGAAKSGRLAEWAKEFDVIAPQFEAAGIKVYNVNDWKTTRITAFPIISFAEFQRLT